MTSTSSLKLKSNAFVGDTGHIDNEIDLPASEGLGRHESGQQEDIFVFFVGHGVIVLASGLRERGLPLPQELDETVVKLHLPATSAALNVLPQDKRVVQASRLTAPFSRGVTTVRKDWLFTTSSHSYIERLSPFSSLCASWHALGHTWCSFRFFLHVPGTQMVVAQVERRHDEPCGGQD